MKFSDLADIIRRECPPDLAARICAAICQAAAGETIYIPSRSGPPEIAPNDTPASVAKRYRVDRSTGYRWVNAWRK